MTQTRKTAVVYWLTPAPPERELFGSIIRILAEELDAPLFEPHLSLFSSGDDHELAKKLLREVTAKRLSLAIRDVQFSGAFTKTLFVRFRSSTPLNRLVRAMQRRAGRRLRKIFEPHLSLCYKSLPAKSKRELVSAIKLPLRRVSFDSIKAVACARPTRTAHDVKTWQVISRRKLRP
jgi:hypothetical protein